jgi:hypothetical protein
MSPFGREKEPPILAVSGDLDMYYVRMDVDRVGPDREAGSGRSYLVRMCRSLRFVGV